MSIAITSVRRLREGLFAEVRLGEDATDCTLVARAATADGAELPVRVVHGEEEGEWSCSLSALTITQVLTLSAVSWEGTTTEERTLKLNPLATRVLSPADMLRRPRHNAPQAPDTRKAMDEWHVTVDRLMATQDGMDVCHGHATLVGAGRQAVEGGVNVSMLDAHGRDLTSGSWVCLSDEVHPQGTYQGFFERRVEFSVKVPTSATTLVVWMRPVEGAEIPGGFASLGPRQTQVLREIWRRQATSAHDDQVFEAWFMDKHAVTPAELSMQQDASFDRGPDFSVVSALHDVTPEALREMAESVLAQSYGHLELVLVNSAPDNKHLASAVRGLELADARVKNVPLAADFGLAAALSEGIDAATGDFVCLLGEGDLLAHDALWQLASAIDRNGEADLLYTDEDRIEHGRHVRPHFKPDWDPDLLLGTNYLGGLTVVRKALLEDMETMQPELDGAQGYRVALYASARARSVVHVPRVLYHARPVRRKAAGAATMAPALAALRQHLEETDASATARFSARVPQGLEVSFALPEADEQPMVSVIIVNRDNVASLERCLTSIRERTTYESYEVVIVEQGSVEPETFEFYRRAEEEDERVRTIFYQGEAGAEQARLINFGVSRAKGDYLLLLSPRTEVTDGGWMGRLVSLCMREGTGAAGARLVRTDGTISLSGVALAPSGPVAMERYLLASDSSNPSASLLHAVTMAPGACLMVDAAAFRKVGGMAVAFSTRFGTEDLCLRLWARGFRVVLDPQVTLTHYRPLYDDEVDDNSAHRLEAIGRLWESWPFGPEATDPHLGPNVAPESPYRILRA